MPILFILGKQFFPNAALCVVVEFGWDSNKNKQTNNENLPKCGGEKNIEKRVFADRPLKEILEMHRGRYEMRNQEHIFDAGGLGEIPIVAVISTCPAARRGLARGPTEHHCRPPPSAHRKYVLTASFQMIPEPDVARLLNKRSRGWFLATAAITFMSGPAERYVCPRDDRPAAVTLVTGRRGG